MMLTSTLTALSLFLSPVSPSPSPKLPSTDGCVLKATYALVKFNTHMDTVWFTDYADLVHYMTTHGKPRGEWVVMKGKMCAIQQFDKDGNRLS